MISTLILEDETYIHLNQTRPSNVQLSQLSGELFTGFPRKTRGKIQKKLFVRLYLPAFLRSLMSEDKVQTAFVRKKILTPTVVQWLIRGKVCLMLDAFFYLKTYLHRHRHVYRHYEAAKPASSKFTCFRNCVKSEILPLGPHFYVHAFSWLSSVIWVVSWSLLKTSFFLINFLLHLSVLWTLTFSITSLTDFLNVFHLFILLFYTITLWAHFSYFCMGKELFLSLTDCVAPTTPRK